MLSSNKYLNLQFILFFYHNIWRGGLPDTGTHTLNHVLINKFMP